MCKCIPIIEVDDDCMLTITIGNKTIFPLRVIELSSDFVKLELADSTLELNKEEVNSLSPDFKQFFKNWMNCQDDKENEETSGLIEYGFIHEFSGEDITKELLDEISGLELPLDSFQVSLIPVKDGNYKGWGEIELIRGVGTAKTRVYGEDRIGELNNNIPIIDGWEIKTKGYPVKISWDYIK